MFPFSPEKRPRKKTTTVPARTIRAQGEGGGSSETETNFSSSNGLRRLLAQKQKQKLSHGRVLPRLVETGLPVLRASLELRPEARSRGQEGLGIADADPARLARSTGARPLRCGTLRCEVARPGTCVRGGRRCQAQKALPASPTELSSSLESRTCVNNVNPVSLHWGLSRHGEGRTQSSGQWLTDGPPLPPWAGDSCRARRGPDSPVPPSSAT